MQIQEVLLIVGIGYVGRRLQHLLMAAGYRIHVIDRKAPEQKGNGNIEFHTCLLYDASILRDVLPRCATVFFLVSESGYEV
jgi:nucleoside-diphosphate-sugar epimerase